MDTNLEPSIPRAGGTTAERITEDGKSCSPEKLKLFAAATVGSKSTPVVGAYSGKIPFLFRGAKAQCLPKEGKDGIGLRARCDSEARGNFPKTW